MKKKFGTLHARAFCHATEDLEKVKTAMKNTLGEVEIKMSRTEGVHGNPIFVLETESDDPESIAFLLGRLTSEDLEETMHSLDARIDEACNLFLRIDKQKAYAADVRLGKGDDVILIRFHIHAFPARSSVACGIMKEFLSRELADRYQHLANT